MTQEIIFPARADGMKIDIIRPREEKLGANLVLYFTVADADIQAAVQTYSIPKGRALSVRIVVEDATEQGSLIAPSRRMVFGVTAPPGES